MTSDNTCMKMTNWKIFWLLFIVISLTLFTACQKLDEDGGYYDEKSKSYKYVKISKRGTQKSAFEVFSPTPGKTQNIQGIATKIGSDAKSIWLKIEDRKPYMIIAERLSGGNRNDKDKEIRVQLKYVSPTGSVTQGVQFRKKWKDYTIEVLKDQLLNKNILVEIDYEESARKLWGTVYRVVKTENGERIRNINLWMIQQGLSYYFIDKGKAADDQKYKDSQKLAKKLNMGLWRY